MNSDHVVLKTVQLHKAQRTNLPIHVPTKILSINDDQTGYGACTTIVVDEYQKRLHRYGLLFLTSGRNRFDGDVGVIMTTTKISLKLTVSCRTRFR